MPEQISDQPLLTVITVVRNNLNGFYSTCLSIAPALDDTVEWLVVDGSDSISDIPNLLEKLNLSHVHVARDSAQGVYPAMNQGLKEASGDFVYFLNAGDQIRSVSNFKDVLQLLRSQSPPWLIARVCFESVDGRSSTPTFDYMKEKRALFARERFPPHQGTIVHTQLLRQLGGFDDSYQIAADYQAMLKLSRTHTPLTSDCALAVFEGGGISSQHWFQAIREFHRARKEVLQPTGLTSLLEGWWTLRATVRQAAFHLVVAPFRQRHR